jgi:TIR domain
VKKAFVSYVKEDARVIDLLRSVLEKNGIDVWLDSATLSPGGRWKSAIEDGIRNGMFFLSIYSKNREKREATYANEELVVAIEELRKKPQDKVWLIPIRIDDCNIENRSIGGGERLLDLQVCDLSDWTKGMTALLSAMGIRNPVVDLGQPLALGLPSKLAVTHGFIRYERIEGSPAIWQGTELRVSNGWCQRDADGKIMAYFGVVAPTHAGRHLYELMGYTGFHAFSEAKEISVSSDSMTIFTYAKRFTIPRGSPFPNEQTGEIGILPFDLPFLASFEARGYIDHLKFTGTFTAQVDSELSFFSHSTKSEGIFEMNFVA